MCILVLKILLTQNKKPKTSKENFKSPECQTLKTKNYGLPTVQKHLTLYKQHFQKMSTETEPQTHKNTKPTINK